MAAPPPATVTRARPSPASVHARSLTVAVAVTVTVAAAYAPAPTPADCTAIVNGVMVQAVSQRYRRKMTTTMQVPRHRPPNTPPPCAAP